MESNSPFTDGAPNKNTEDLNSSEGYPAWKKNNPKLTFQELLKKYGVVIAGGGIFVVVLLVLNMFMPDDRKSKNDNLIKTFDGKYNIMENRINNLEKALEEKGFGVQGQKVEALKEKIESLEASLNLKINDAIKKIDDIEKRAKSGDSNHKQAAASEQKQAAAEKKKPGEGEQKKSGEEKSKKPAEVDSKKPVEEAKKKPAESDPKSSDRKPAKDSKSKGKTKYHTVTKNDTLFGISRKYDIDIKDLCRVNKIKPSARIQPGQKLIVDY